MLIVLADHAHDDGSGAYPSVETIGRKARLSRSGTFKVLAQLKADGHIEPDGKGAHGTVSYRIPMPEGVQSVEVQSVDPSTESGEGVHGSGPEPSLTIQLPPKPPKGGRARDRKAFLEEVSIWIAAELPSLTGTPQVENAVSQALRDGAQSPAEVEAFLAKWWPELPSGDGS